MTLLLLLLSHVLPSAPILRGPSTVYWLGDGYNNGKLGCTAAAKRHLGHDRLRDELPIVATRGKRKPIACGDLVLVTNLRTNLSTLARKLDTGPWSAYRDGERITCLDCPPGWRRRSMVDLSRAVAAAIGHDGYDPIEVRKVGW